MNITMDQIIKNWIAQEHFNDILSMRYANSVRREEANVICDLSDDEFTLVSEERCTVDNNDSPFVERGKPVNTAFDSTTPTAK